MGIFDKLNPFKKKGDDFGKFNLGKDPFKDGFGGDKGSEDSHSSLGGFPQGHDGSYGLDLGSDSKMHAGFSDSPDAFSSLNQPLDKLSGFSEPSVSSTDFSSQPMRRGDISIHDPEPSPQTVVGGRDKDLEIVSAKLDSIKAQLDSMNTRLKNLERMAMDEIDSQKQNSRKYW